MTIKTKVDREGRQFKSGGSPRYQEFAKHGATVHKTPATQWAELNVLGEPVCSMWLRDTDGLQGICNFRGGGRDCGDHIRKGMLVRIVQQDGYRMLNGTMKTTFAHALPTYWVAMEKRSPKPGSRPDHKFDWIMARTAEPVKHLT